MRSYLLYLEDILKSTAKVCRYTDGMSFEDFLADERTMDAVVRKVVFSLQLQQLLGKRILEKLQST